jgi:hydroxymethylpyrimidine/phosphomethylpyrimidine kinase
VRASGTVMLAVPRVATGNTRGTGCSLSSAIAAGLAKGEDLETAVRNAKAFISAAIAAADRVGRRRGPVHHFHRFYQRRRIVSSGLELGPHSRFYHGAATARA